MTGIRPGNDGATMTDRQMTYDALASALGKTPDAARQLVKRKRWRRTIGNDGKARITVPDDELQPDASPRRIPDGPPTPHLTPAAKVRPRQADEFCSEAAIAINVEIRWSVILRVNV